MSSICWPWNAATQAEHAVPAGVGSQHAGGAIQTVADDHCNGRPADSRVEASGVFSLNVDGQPLGHDAGSKAKLAAGLWFQLRLCSSCGLQNALVSGAGTAQVLPASVSWHEETTASLKTQALY